MTDNGMQDMIGLLNVTLSATSQLGKVGVAATKGSVYVLSRLFRLLKWIALTIHDAPYHKTGGKKDMKVLATQFHDLKYNEYKFGYALNFLEGKYSANAELVDINKARVVLSPTALQKKFEELSKKCGFVYSKVPNFVVNKETGRVEFRIAYSASQQEAYDEVVSQLSAYIDKTIKKCMKKKVTQGTNGGAAGITQEEINDVIGRTLPEEKQLASCINELGLGEVSEEEYNSAMKETFPEYVPETPKEPAEEKKTDYIEITDKNEYTREKANGNVKEFTFSNIRKNDKETGELTVVLDEYPNVMVTFNTASALKADASFDTDRGVVVWHVAMNKDTVCEFDIYLADPVTKEIDFSQNPKHYSMTMKEFELLMAQNVSKSKEKVATLLEAKQNLPAVATPGTKKK